MNFLCKSGEDAVINGDKTKVAIWNWVSEILWKKWVFTAIGEEQKEKRINWNLILLIWVTLGFFSTL